jgi:hypothetical protein
MGPEIGTCIGIDASVVWMSSSQVFLYVRLGYHEMLYSLYTGGSRNRLWCTACTEVYCSSETSFQMGEGSLGLATYEGTKP